MESTRRMTFSKHVETIVDVSNLPLDNIMKKRIKKKSENFADSSIVKMPPSVVNSTSSRESVACPYTIGTLLKRPI